MKPLELEGKRIGKITILKRIENNKYGQSRWLCRCDCGNEWIIQSSNLWRIKQCKSCSNKNRPIKHGDSRKRLNNIYLGMRNRCENPGNSSYEHYGKRGIRVAEEWKDYETFKTWALNNGYDDSKSIERIDVNKDYTPDNCAWIDLKNQCFNKRNSLRFEMNGVIKDLAQIAKEKNINYYTLYSRIKTGMDIETAVKKPIKR